MYSALVVVSYVVFLLRSSRLKCIVHDEIPVKVLGRLKTCYIGYFNVGGLKFGQCPYESVYLLNKSIYFCLNISFYERNEER